MPYRFNPSSRPNGHTYTAGYALVLTAPICVVAGLLHSDWRFVLLGIGSLVVSTTFYALLGWWRERYDALHPDEVDFNSERVDTWLETFSLRIVHAIANVFKRRGRLGG